MKNGMTEFQWEQLERVNMLVQFCFSTSAMFVGYISNVLSKQHGDSAEALAELMVASWHRQVVDARAQRVPSNYQPVVPDDRFHALLEELTSELRIAALASVSAYKDFLKENREPKDEARN